MQLSTLVNLMKMTTELRKLAPELPIQQLQAFLAVALQEGITTKDIEKRCGFTSASASRNVQALYKHAGAGREGYGWVVWHPSPHDGRFRELYLTEEGKEALKTLVEALER